MELNGIDVYNGEHVYHLTLCDIHLLEAQESTPFPYQTCMGIHPNEDHCELCE